jgi:hypothetical protein
VGNRDEGATGSGEPDTTGVRIFDPTGGGAVSRFTQTCWNDSEDRLATQDVNTNSSNRLRRVLRRLDDWTLTVFNPYLHSNHR